MACPFWGANKWGDGSTYCNTSANAFPYSVDVDDTLIHLYQWNLQSPDGTIWSPTISTLGVVTWTPSATGTLNPVPAPLFVAQNGDLYYPSIANTGIVTINVQATANQSQAALTDSSGQDWEFSIDTLDEVVLLPLYAQYPRPHYWQVRVKHSSAGDFRIYTTRPICADDNYYPFNYSTSLVDDASQMYIAISIKHSDNSDLQIYWIRPEVKIKEQEPVG